MSDAQLKTAAKLSSAKPKQKKLTTPPKARPPSVALKATPAPARGQQDELLFDPDEESFGEAGPGGGFDVGDVNVPIGMQQGLGASSTTGTAGVSAGTATASPEEGANDAAANGEPEEPLVIDLEDDPKTPPPQTESGRGLGFWILLVGGLVVCGFCLMMMWQRGGSGSSPAPGTMDLYGGFGGMGGVGGMGTVGTSGLGGIGTGSLI